MRMIKKNWKDRKGVSPVIATILMVAITVVLAAVLYVMVMGFGGDSGNIPNGEFKTPEKSTATGLTSYKIQVLSISEAKDFDDMRFSVSKDTTAVYMLKSGDLALAQGNTKIVGVDVSFTDLNGDGKVSTGDFFTVELATGSTDPAATGAYTTALSFSPASGAGGVICETSFTL